MSLLSDPRVSTLRDGICKMFHRTPVPALSKERLAQFKDWHVVRATLAAGALDPRYSVELQCADAAAADLVAASLFNVGYDITWHTINGRGEELLTRASVHADTDEVDLNATLLRTEALLR